MDKFLISKVTKHCLKCNLGIFITKSLCCFALNGYGKLLSIYSIVDILFFCSRRIDRIDRIAVQLHFRIFCEMKNLLDLIFKYKLCCIAGNFLRDGIVVFLLSFSKLQLVLACAVLSCTYLLLRLIYRFRLVDGNAGYSIV